MTNADQAQLDALNAAYECCLSALVCETAEEKQRYLEMMLYELAGAEGFRELYQTLRWKRVAVDPSTPPAFSVVMKRAMESIELEADV